MKKNKHKHKGEGIFYSFLIIFIHAIGHWLTVQYQDNMGFKHFVDDFKGMIFGYFNGNIPLRITIGVSAFMIVMIIVSSFWHYDND